MADLANKKKLTEVPIDNLPDEGYVIMSVAGMDGAHLVRIPVEHFLNVNTDLTKKTRIDFDGSKFRIGDTVLNYKDLYERHIVKSDFAFVVYGDRAYLLSYVQDGSGMKEMRFQSVIAVTDAASISNVKVSGIYVKSSDGVSIASVEIVDVNSENKGYKASTIAGDNQNNVWYPSVKAVVDYVRNYTADIPYLVPDVVRNVTAGSSTEISVSYPSAKVTSYQWQYSANNGSTWYNSSLEGADTATIFISDATRAVVDGRLFRCKMVLTDGRTVFSGRTLIKVVAASEGGSSDGPTKEELSNYYTKAQSDARYAFKGETGGVVGETLPTVTSISQMTDTSKKYVLDGWVYQYEQVSTGGESVPNFTNQIPISVDSNGNVFNGTGYKTGYRINSSAVEAEQAGDWVTGFMPMAIGDTFYFKNLSLNTASSNGCAVGFYDSNKINGVSIQLRHAAQGSATPLQYVDIEMSESGELVSITIKDFSSIRNKVFIRFTGDGKTCPDPSKAIITRNEEISYTTGGATHYEWVKKYQYVEGENPLTGLEKRVSDVESKATANATNIASLSVRVKEIEDNGVNTPTQEETVIYKYREQLDRAEQLGYKSCDYLGAKSMLNFLHISDTHGSVNVKNAVDILNKLKADGNCSFLIHTGDFYAETFASDFNTFAGYIGQANAPFMLVSGNHDVGNNKTSGAEICTDTQLYNKAFAPYIGGWGVSNNPTGKCYYYKDFTDSQVRFIGLHDFESDYNGSGTLSKGRGYCAYTQAQIDWLINALMTCPADYGVIIAKHNPVNIRGNLDNAFNSRYLIGKNTAQSNVDKNIIADIVQAFIDGVTVSKTYAQSAGVVTTLNVSADFSAKNENAEFVCYLNGHTHADGVNFLKDYPKQLELNIGCDNTHYQHYSDTLNEAGTLHQDLINYVSVDRNRGHVYIQRIGNDFSASVDRRDFTSINYRNPPVEEIGGEVVYTKILDVTTSEAEKLNLTGLKIKEGVVQFLYPKANVSATTFNVYSGSKIVSSGYHGQADLSTGSYPGWKMEIYQKNGFWYSTSSSSATKNVSGMYPSDAVTGGRYLFTFDVKTYPYIDKITTDAVLPVGTNIVIWGVRA